MCIEKIIASLIMVITSIYLLGKIQSKAMNLKNIKTYISIIILFLLILFNFYYIPSILKMFLLLFYFFIINIFLYKSTKYEALSSALFVETITFIVELIIMIIIAPIFKNIGSIYLIISNILVSIILILILKLKLVNNMYKKFLKYLLFIGKYKSILYTIYILLTLNIYLYLYYNIQINESKIFLYLIIMMSIIYLIIISISIKKSYKFNELKDKYNTILPTINDYEKMLNKFRIVNHENKNHLLMIKNMINSNDKNISKYIDEIVKDKINEDVKILYDVNEVPAGGLRATIYSKLVKMKNNNIDYNIEISEEAKEFDSNCLSSSTIIDICNILSIFLDNAIDASLTNKEREITYEVYLDNTYVIINISNVIEEEIDLKKISIPGYTTKKDGHGYGLALVERIISENEKLINTYKIENDLFIQTLKVKTQ